MRFYHVGIATFVAVLAGRTFAQSGGAKPEDTPPGSTQPGSNQMDPNQQGSNQGVKPDATQPGSTIPGATMPGETTRLRGALSDADLQVLGKLHHANQMEIEAGMAAKSNAESASVKSYGDQLVKDHQEADKMVLDLAKQYSAKIPAPKAKDEAEQTLMKKDMDKMTRLKGLRGAEFDREFLTSMANDHEANILLVKGARMTTQNEALKASLDKILPTLEKHRDMAQDLARKIKSAS